MASSGIAASPAEFLGRCPRCKILRLFLNTSQGGAQYTCSGCEWPFTIGDPSVAAPGVPASNTAVTNTTGTIVAVTVSSGTLTSVKVNGSQVGTTDGTYYVPAGSNISITYSVAPTWTWALPVTNGAMAAGATAIPVAAGGTSYTPGETLYIDGTAPEVLTVGTGSTSTSIAISTPGGCTLAHNSGVSFGDLLPSPTLSHVEVVPNVGGYGF